MPIMNSEARTVMWREFALLYRRQLLAEITARSQQLSQLRLPALIERASAALARLRQDKAELDRLIRSTIAVDPGLQAKATLLQVAPAAGPILLATLLALLPELGTLDRHQIASLVGLAPVTKDSGSMPSRRVIHSGRKESATASSWPRSPSADAGRAQRSSTAPSSPRASPRSSPWSPPCASCWSPPTPSPRPTATGKNHTSQPPHEPLPTTVAG
jgi:hypothetical protein